MIHDVEAEIIAYLSDNLACSVYAEVPNPRPDTFITVERTGGGSSEHGAIDRPTVAIQSWARTRREAANLAIKANSLMLEMPFESLKVMGCECNSLYNFPDPDSHQSRYQGLYDMVTN